MSVEDRTDRTLENEEVSLVLSPAGLFPLRTLPPRERDDRFFCQRSWQAGSISAGAGSGSRSSGVPGKLVFAVPFRSLLPRLLEREIFHLLDRRRSLPKTQIEPWKDDTGCQPPSTVARQANFLAFPMADGGFSSRSESNRPSSLLSGRSLAQDFWQTSHW